MLFQPGIHTGEMFQLPFLNAGSRDLRPELNDTSKVIDREFRTTDSLEFCPLPIELDFFRAQLGYTGVAFVQILLRVYNIIRDCLGHESVPFKTDIFKIPVNNHAAGDILIFQIYIRAGFIQKVNRFVGKIAVCNITLTQRYGITAHLLGDGNTVKVFIIMSDAFDDFNAVFNGGFFHGNRLKPAFESGIFFDMFAVFIKRRRPDNLDFPAGQCRFQNIGSIHAALRISGSDNSVDFVNHQNNIALAAYLFNETFHAAFKLAAELRTGNQRRQVKEEDLLFLQFHRNTAHGNPLGEALGNCRFAHAGIPDQAGIVFLTTVKNLYDTLELFFPADHSIQLPFGSTSCQINAVVIQILMPSLA